MITITRVSKWSAHMIEYLMNAISMFQNHQNLIQENAMLRQKLLQCNQRSNDDRQSDSSAYQVYALSASDHHYSETFESEPEPSSMTMETGATSTNDNENLRKEIASYREKNAQLLERYAQLTDGLKQKKIESFESLATQDKATLRLLIELARLTEPFYMEGNNIGLFGSTSTGKSTMLNALLGKQVADTGVGETTTKITPYKGSKYILWDVPGRNDEISYFTMEYISFFKGLTHRVILIQATVKENSSMMKLLDEIGLRYHIVFNKFDKVDEDERSAVQKQIQAEVKTIGLKGVERIFFISAKYPQMFPDWLTMVDTLINP